MTAIAERVAAGAAFLDEHDPGWWRADVERAIDLDTLGMESGRHCILGQRCPVGAGHIGWRYTAFAAILSGRTEDFYGSTDAWMDAINDWAAPLGFQADRHDDEDFPLEEDEYEALGAEWKRVITGRRAAS